MGSYKNSSSKIGSAEIGPIEIGFAEIGFTKINSPEIGAKEVGSAEIDSFEIGLCEIDGNLEVLISPLVPDLGALLQSCQLLCVCHCSSLSGLDGRRPPPRKQKYKTKIAFSIHIAKGKAFPRSIRLSCFL